MGASERWAHAGLGDPFPSDFDKQGFEIIYSDSFAEIVNNELVTGVQNAFEPLDVALAALPFKFGVTGSFGRTTVGGTTETFFRTMSSEHAAELMATGRLPATGETFVSSRMSEALNYRGTLMKMEVRSGTTGQLESIGVRNFARGHPFPDMPIVQRGWSYKSAFFKVENKGVNIGLGKGDALNTFNCNIITCSQVTP